MSAGWATKLPLQGSFREIELYPSLGSPPVTRDPTGGKRMRIKENLNRFFGFWLTGVLSGGLILAALVVAACSSSSSSNTTGQMAMVSVHISDPATCEAPSGPFSHVFVTITDVQANVNSTAGSSDNGWV